MSRRVTGILGGMGPEATILLQQRVLGTVSAADDSDHLPLLIDMNPQVPSRISHLIEGTGEDPSSVLVEMAKRLETAGATALAMPCNTAHHYAPQVQAAVSIPFLNMIDLSVARAAQQVTKGARLGILASPAVQRTKVFDASIEAAGFTALWPQDAEKMLVAIRDIKANGSTPEALGILSDAAAELAENGAELIFVACSEFSILSSALTASVPVIDTVDVLVDAIHHHTLLKPR